MRKIYNNLPVLSILMIALFVPSFAVLAQTYYPSPSQAAQSSVSSSSPSTTTSTANSNSSITTSSTSFSQSGTPATTSGSGLSALTGPNFNLNTVLRNSGISVAENSTGSMTVTIPKDSLIALLQQFTLLLAQLNLKLMR